jgi:hypothetical protein
MSKILSVALSLFLLFSLPWLLSCKKEEKKVGGEGKTKPEEVVTEEAKEQNAVKEVANKFFTATKDNDLALYKSIITTADLARVSSQTEQALAKYQQEYKELNYEIVRVTIIGEKAKVAIKINYVKADPSGSSGSAEDVLKMVKEEGKWRLVAPF